MVPNKNTIKAVINTPTNDIEQDIKADRIINADNSLPSKSLIDWLKRLLIKIQMTNTQEYLGGITLVNNKIKPSGLMITFNQQYIFR